MLQQGLVPCPREKLSLSGLVIPRHRSNSPDQALLSLCSVKFYAQRGMPSRVTRLWSFYARYGIKLISQVKYYLPRLVQYFTILVRSNVFPTAWQGLVLLSQVKYYLPRLVPSANLVNCAAVYSHTLPSALLSNTHVLSSTLPLTTVSIFSTPISV